MYARSAKPNLLFYLCVRNSLLCLMQLLSLPASVSRTYLKSL